MTSRPGPTLILIGCFLLLPCWAFAGEDIRELFTEGSRWTLHVDAAVGALDLISVEREETRRDGNALLGVKVAFLGRGGMLQARDASTTGDRHVLLVVQRDDGIPVTCDGYVSHESADFMGGTTEYSDANGTHRGAWYATRVTSGQVPDAEDVSEEAEPQAEAASVLRKSPYRLKSIGESACSISGKVYGRGAIRAAAFFVALYGPDNPTLFRAQQVFTPEGTYSFADLPEGNYRLSVGTKADTIIAPHPASTTVACDREPVGDVDFELR